MNDHQMLSGRAKALRPMIQAAYDAGGLDGVCEAVAGIIAPLEACVEQLMARVALLVFLLAALGTATYGLLAAWSDAASLKARWSVVLRRS